MRLPTCGRLSLHFRSSMPSTCPQGKVARSAAICRYVVCKQLRRHCKAKRVDLLDVSEIHMSLTLCRHSYGSDEPFTLLYLSAAINLPFSICCSLFIGVSEGARNLWRGLDIFFIFTCAGTSSLHTRSMNKCIVTLSYAPLSRVPVWLCQLQGAYHRILLCWGASLS